jgi:glycosyltransferase involved in cell wall biosynthesis
VAIWYTHKATNWRLHFATIFVDNICTASLESCHINSKKINIFGHGIDGEKFYCKSPHLVSDKLKILTVGRISPIKNLNLMIESVKELKEREKKVALNIVGGPVNKLDSDYLKSIKNLIAKNDLEEEINFLGEKKYDELAEIYCEHNIFLHCSDTGSLDKVVLEAGLCGLLIVTTSIAYQNFPLTFVANKPDKIASAIISQVDNPFESLRECVLENHSLANLIKKIIKLYA